MMILNVSVEEEDIIIFMMLEKWIEQSLSSRTKKIIKSRSNTTERSKIEKIKS